MAVVVADDVVNTLLSRLQPLLQNVAFAAAKQALAEAGVAPQGGTDVGEVEPNKKLQVSWRVWKPVEMKNVTMQLVRGSLRVDSMNVVDNDHLGEAEVVFHTPQSPGPFFAVFRLIDSATNTCVGPDLPLCGHVAGSLISANDAVNMMSAVPSTQAAGSAPVSSSQPVAPVPGNTAPSQVVAVGVPVVPGEKPGPVPQVSASSAAPNIPSGALAGAPQAAPGRAPTLASVPPRQSAGIVAPVPAPAAPDRVLPAQSQVGTGVHLGAPVPAQAQLNQGQAASSGTKPGTVQSLAGGQSSLADSGSDWYRLFVSFFASAVANATPWPSDLQEREVVERLWKYSEEQKINNEKKGIILDDTLAAIFRQPRGTEIPLSKLIRYVRELISLYVAHIDAEQKKN